MSNILPKESDFVIVRCYSCGKVLFEVSIEAKGTVRKKCDNNRCKAMRIISLPYDAKKANVKPARI